MSREFPAFLKPGYHSELKLQEPSSQLNKTSEALETVWASLDPSIEYSLAEKMDGVIALERIDCIIGRIGAITTSYLIYMHYQELHSPHLASTNRDLPSATDALTLCGLLLFTTNLIKNKLSKEILQSIENLEKQ